MSTRRSGISLLVSVLMVVMLGEVASAHTKVFSTSLTLKSSESSPVAEGTRVTFFGRLRSGKPACQANSRVKLVRVGFGVVMSTMTNADGKYSFSKRIRRTHRWRVRFDGKVLNAVHPHDHTCEASISDRLRLVVT